MSILQDLKPLRKSKIMDLLSETGCDVSAWGDYDGPPAANPKYCYNWSFEQPGEFVVLCMWHKSFKVRGGKVIHESWQPRVGRAGRAAVVNSRAIAFDAAMETAFRQRLPVRVIVVDEPRQTGRPRSGRASSVGARTLDPAPWAVADYDYQTGRRLLVRGLKPRKTPLEVADLELVGFEGKTRQKFIAHRQREGWIRRAKIRAAMQKSNGRLVCEVRKCGFDFKKRYGPLGEGYAQVHHLVPLSRAPLQGHEVRLSDLAIVCANCHAMIHRDGESRRLGTLIP